MTYVVPGVMTANKSYLHGTREGMKVLLFTEKNSERFGKLIDAIELFVPIKHITLLQGVSKFTTALQKLGQNGKEIIAVLMFESAKALDG